jgi:hypothetical protein
MMRIVLTATVIAGILAGGVGASASVTLFATDVVGRNLYRIDTGSWDVELVGYHGVASGFCGMAFDPNRDQLIGITRYTTARLYCIDPNTAGATLIGSLNVGYVFEGGLVYDPERGVLYGGNAGSNENPQIFTVNPVTGAGAIIGRVGTTDHDFAGFAFGEDGELYGLDGATTAMWRIDLNDVDGPGTQQLGTGLGAGIDLGSVGGLASDELGNVYGYASGSHQIFSVDMTTGAATVLHTFGANVPVFYSLSYGGGAPSAVKETSWTSIKALYAR